MANDTPTTLYRLYGTGGELLYIGIAGNPGRRFEQHRADKPWWGDVVGITLEHHPTRAQAADAELEAIQAENPRHNIAGRTAPTRRRHHGRPTLPVRYQPAVPIEDTDLDPADYPDHCEICTRHPDHTWGDPDTWIRHPHLVRVADDNTAIRAIYRCPRHGNTWIVWWAHQPAGAAT